MAQYDGGRALPKFGEWDVNNPASADGFTVIFAKARDEKIAGSGSAQAHHNNHTQEPTRSFQGTTTTRTTKWFCCF